MKIYREGILLFDALHSDRSVHKAELNGDEYVAIDFVHSSNLGLRKGDYIVHEEIAYTLHRNYIPEVDKATGGFKFDLKFYTKEKRFEDFNFVHAYVNEDVAVEETEFKLTSDCAGHLTIVKENILRCSLGLYSVDQAPDEVKEINYSNLSIAEAAALIASTYNLDLWYGNFTINISKKQVGSGIPLTVNTHIEDLTSSDSQEEPVNRIVAFGSTANLPTNYRGAKGIAGIVSQNRLRLPVGINYVSIDEVPHSEAIEDVVIFEDIYPRMLGSITALTETLIEGDGVETQDTYIYKFKDSALVFSLSYILAGFTLKARFSSGFLNGREFDLIFDETEQEFEIKYTQEGSLVIPNNYLKPVVGDNYTLLNFDASKIEEMGLVSEAENRLLERAEQHLLNLGSDKVYTSKTKSIKCEEDDINISLGDYVLIYSSYLNLATRVIGFEKNLNNPYDCTYSFGDSKKFSRLEAIEKSIVEPKNTVIKTSQNSGVEVLSIISPSPLSDRNVLSSLRSRKEFLRKDIADTAAERISFDKGFDAYDFVQGQLLGTGLGVFEDGSGNSVLEVDKLSVRKEAWFNEIVINQIRFQGGVVVYSAAALEILTVQFFSTYIQVKFDTKNGQIANQFVVDDQVRCQRFVGGSVTKYYMSRVTSVGADYINLSRQDYDGTLNPEIGDMIVQFGNRTDVNRQALIEINALYGGKQTFYNGVNSYSLTDKNIIDIGRVLVDNQLQNLIRVYGNAYVGARNLSSYFKFDSATGLAEFKGKITFQSGKTDTELESEIAGFGSDGIITPAEKRELKIQWDEIAYEFMDLYDQGVALGAASLGDFNDYYSALYSYLFINPNLLNPANMGIDSTIVPSAYKLVWTGFLKSRAALRTEIAAAIYVLVDMAISDGVLTPAEKLQLKSMWDGMVADHGRVVRRSTAAGITAYTVYTTFVAKYNALVTYLDPIFANMSANSTIVPATFKTVFSDYTTAKAEVEKYLEERDEQTIASMIADINKAISDSWITPAEKRGLKIQWDTIEGEIGSLYNQANNLGCASTSNYYTAYTTLKNYISSIGLFVNMSASVYIANVTTFRAYWIAYYQYKEIILSEINEKLGIKASAADYLRTAMQGSTDITGGLLLTNLLLMKSAGGSIRGGMSGLVGDPVGTWAGGTYEQALTDAGKAFKSAMESAALDKKSDGSGHRAFGNLAWNAEGDVFVKGIIEALVGHFGMLTISGNSVFGNGIEFSDTPVEALSSLLSPVAVSINRQSSWGYGYSANTQTIVLSRAASLSFKIYTFDQGAGAGYVWEINDSTTNEVVATGEHPTSNTIDLINVKLPAGSYYIFGRPYKTGTNSTTKLFGASTDDTITAYGYVSKTKIGNNGFFSFWTSTIYFYFSAVYGLEFRFGNYGVRAISSGLQKMTAGTWVSL